MRVYLDASVLVALFTNDLFTGHADRTLMAENAKAIGFRVATG